MKKKIALISLVVMTTASTLWSAGMIMTIHRSNSAVASVNYLVADVDSVTFTKIDTTMPEDIVPIPGGLLQVKYSLPRTVAPFLLSKHEVSQKEFSKVMNVNPTNVKGDSLPVSTVTWYDAVLYCNARSKAEGRDTVYTYSSVRGFPGNGVIDLPDFSIDSAANGYYLPTKQQWEFAARAGSQEQFFWGDDETADSVGQYVVYTGNSGGKINTVTSKKPNGFGLYDMLGNVSEWTESRHGVHTGYFVHKGGAYNSAPYALSLSSDETGLVQSAKFGTIGFRVALGARPK